MSSRTMSGRVMTFGVQEKAIRFRIMAGSGANWNTPIAVGGRGTQANSNLLGLGIAPGVASVARTAAGKFTVTLEDAYARLVTAQASYQSSSDAEDLVAQVGAIANLGTATPATIVIKTKAIGVNADPGTQDQNTSINVDLVFEDSVGV